MKNRIIAVSSERRVIQRQKKPRAEPNGQNMEIYPGPAVFPLVYKPVNCLQHFHFLSPQTINLTNAIPAEITAFATKKAKGVAITIPKPIKNTCKKCNHESSISIPFSPFFQKPLDFCVYAMI